MTVNKVTLIGNPNAGKTLLFNTLTGSKQKVGNWAGVTVDKKEGIWHYNKQDIVVIDLPGIYSINNTQNSIDEQIVKDFVTNNDYLYLNIIDGTTIERGLRLTIQLLNLGLKVVVIVNMMDIVDKIGMKLDLDKLAKILTCKVISVSVKNNFDAKKLFKSIQSSSIKINFNYLNYINNNEKLLAEKEFIAANNIAKTITIKNNNLQNKATVSDKIDNIVLGNFSGIPIFLIIMYLLFLFSISFGGVFIDFFDILTNAIFVDGMRDLLQNLYIPEFFILLIADGIGGGIAVVATFIPIIATLYLFLTILEEIGYIARAALVMDKFMRKIRLSGKAFIPLIIGFGCNVPAIMASRVLDTHRERVTTVLMSPFMSCGARLTVYVLFAMVFFNNGGQNMVFLLYIIGIIAAILTGFIIQKGFNVGNDDNALVVELPIYRLPSVRSTLINTWNKLKGFVLGAGKIIIIVVSFITVINNIGIDGSFNNQNSQNSILSVAAKTVTPVFAPLGIENNNWPAVVGILTGILTKEVVVGTLDSLYSNIGNNHTATKLTVNDNNLFSVIKNALDSIAVNFNYAMNNLADPLGFSVIDNSLSLAVAAKTQGVNYNTLAAMSSRFDGKIGAFAYLLFILLYFPCIAATNAMFREVGRKWAVIGVLWSTTLAYSISIIFYQSATISQHYLSSILWIVFMIALLILAAKIMINASKNEVSTAIPIITNTNCRHCD